MKINGPMNHERSWGHFLTKCLGFNFAAALFVPVVTWSFVKSYSPQEAWTDFIAGSVYSNCIGIQLALVLPSIWPLYPTRRAKWLLRLLVVLAICVVGTLVAGLIFPMLLHIHIDYWETFRRNVRISIILGVAISFLIASFESLQHRLEVSQLALRTQELERERALKLATEAQLTSLESRIHPHFLFNTINSVSSLIHEDPDRAERLLERMAALLRFSLDAHQRGLVPLEREMKIVADYLEIERTRFGDRLRFSVECSSAIGQIGVPPLSIQTLVENSVKYAVAPKREGGQISVRAITKGNSLEVDVWDDGPNFRLELIPAAHGLDNLQSRLNTLFPSGTGLQVDGSGQGKTVRMTVPVATDRKIA